MGLPTFDILGVQVGVLNPPMAVSHIMKWVKQQKKVYVCVAPVSTIVDCQRVKGYKDIINHAAMVTPDGMPVVWFAKIKGYNVSRTYGPSLMRHICDQGQSEGLRHFLYGSTEATLERLQASLKASYPQIQIAGAYAPPFSTDVGREQEEVIQRMNRSRSDILWVGLGAPKQDFWMDIHRPLLNVPVMVGIGAAFDFISGIKPQAPRWMQNMGLEWFFRLCCEPRRLWRRYLIGNILFIGYIIRDSWQHRKFLK